jgi:AcrR family transcriptional regulator
MPRAYRSDRREQGRAETRGRIVEAAIDLHQRLGPAFTSASEIAREAGVGRVTFYRHFPDEASLLAACGGTYFSRHPFPEIAVDSRVAPRDVLRGALRQSYAYHADTEAMMARVLPQVGQREVMAPYHDHWNRVAERVTATFGTRGRPRKALRAAIGLALAFETWRTLVRAHGLTPDEAVEVMSRLALGAHGAPRKRG